MSSLFRRAWLLLILAIAFSSASLAQDADDLSAADLAAVKAAQKQRVDTIAKVYGAVVAIYGNDRGGGGSGVLYDPAGFALTNHHVVAGAGTEGWGGLADGKLYRWKLIGTDPGGDVAIIQLTGKDPFPYAPLADSETVRVGDWAMAMGNPFVLAEDQRPTVTLGIVSGVHRFQEGSGMNQLVYGNCIQVDSSINPGNSGGPLFSLRGQILGINGRGSFEERGRVNVGLGYAISANQCRMFIPELLATKIAQHGTLDAVFGTREGKVICHTVNLDSAIAKAGLQLGDKLLSFEGQPVVDANQFTNDLSMYPADWPVAVTWERDGKPMTAHIRLSALPYEPIVKKTEEPPPEEKPAGEKPGEEKPQEEKPGEKKPAEKPAEDKPAKPAEEKKEEPAKDKPAEKPAEKDVKKIEKKEEKPDPNAPPNPRDLPKELPKERLIPPKPKIPLGEAGKVRDKELNEKNPVQIAARWREQCGAAALKETGVAYRMESILLRDGKAAGKQQLTIASAGRCRVDYELDGKKRTLGTDGKVFWLEADGKSQEVTQSRAMRDPHFSSAVALAALLSPKPLESLGDLALDGADKGRGRLCYRLSSTDKESEQLFVWLSVCNDAIEPSVQLQKTGVGTDDEEPIAAVTYDHWKQSDGLQLPHKMTLVRGLAEVPELSIEAQSCSAVAEIDDAFFQAPKNETPNSNILATVAALLLFAAPSLAADDPVSPDGAFAEAIEFAQRRTVKIYGAGIGRSPAYASGILVSSTGDVLTGNGVYLGADNLRITLPDGSTFPATVVRRSQSLQVAQLKIEANTPDFFQIPEKPAAGKGDWILAVSNAFKVADRSEPLSVNIGVLSLRTRLDARRGVNDFPYDGDVYLYDAITSNPGAAGGAVVSTDGKLVGMIGRVIESKSTNTRLNYAVPADTLKKFMSGEEPMPAVAVTPSTGGKGELGIRLFNLGGRKSPAYIDRVVPGSAAAKAGLKTDDMVVSIGGEIVRDAGDFRRLSENLKAGVETTIEVKRKNDLLTIKLTPSEAK